MSERTEADFLEWIGGGISVYVGYARYGQLGSHGFVCACTWDEPEDLARYVDDLDGGDNEAIDAAQWIRKRDGIWWANDPDPAKAMQKMLDALRRYYFIELNKQPLPAARAAEQQTCVHPWEKVGINADGNPFCVECLTNLVKDPPWRASSNQP